MVKMDMLRRVANPTGMVKTSDRPLAGLGLRLCNELSSISFIYLCTGRFLPTRWNWIPNNLGKFNTDSLY